MSESGKQRTHKIQSGDIVRIIIDNKKSDELFLVSDVLENDKYTLIDSKYHTKTYDRADIYYQPLPSFVAVTQNVKGADELHEIEMKDAEIVVNSGLMTFDGLLTYYKNAYGIDAGKPPGVLSRLLISILNYYSKLGYICVHYEDTCQGGEQKLYGIEFQMEKKDHKPRDYNGTKYRYFLNYRNTYSGGWITKEVKYDILPEPETA